MKSILLQVTIFCIYKLFPILSDGIGCKGCPENSAACTRQVWSIMNKNDEWSGHDYHEQVWYHTLNETHDLWQEGYFDYVLDIRPPESQTSKSGNYLAGWEEFHIPGSFPIAMYPIDVPADEVEMLVPFDSSVVCKDSRIFLHCWSGNSANYVAKTLIEMGFTNIHAMGPQFHAGIWDWKENGWELVYNDTFDPTEERLQPKCIDACVDKN